MKKIVDEQQEEMVWGWDDKAMAAFDKDHALILNKIK